MRSFVMPARTLDYLLMGIIAGIIAGLILVYIGGITIYAVIEAGQNIRSAFKMP